MNNIPLKAKAAIMVTRMLLGVAIMVMTVDTVIRASLDGDHSELRYIQTASQLPHQERVLVYQLRQSFRERKFEVRTPKNCVGRS